MCKGEKMKMKKVNYPRVSNGDRLTKMLTRARKLQRRQKIDRRKIY